MRRLNLQQSIRWRFEAPCEGENAARCVPERHAVVGVVAMPGEFYLACELQQLEHLPIK